MCICIWYCAFRWFNKRIHLSEGHDMDNKKYQTPTIENALRILFKDGLVNPLWKKNYLLI
jgi:hypothetical protein